MSNTRKETLSKFIDRVDNTPPHDSDTHLTCFGMDGKLPKGWYRNKFGQACAHIVCKDGKKTYVKDKGLK